MRPVQAIKTCLAKSFQFSGRASRSEFWWFFPTGAGLPILNAWLLPPEVKSLNALLLKLLMTALAAIPLNAAASRRFHDTGLSHDEFWLGIGPTLGLVFSGWFLMLALFGISTIVYVVPGLLIGIPAALLFIACLIVAPSSLGATIGHLLLPSSPGPNKYGPNPLEVTP